MFWKQCLKTLLKLKPLGVAGENVQWHPTVEDNTVVPLKIKQRGFWEDSRMGCTRNPPLHLDNNCTGRICLIQLFWNSGVYWRLQLPGEGLDGKLCLISVTFSLLAQQHLTIPKPLRLTHLFPTQKTVNRSHCPGLKPCVISLTPDFLLHPKSKSSIFYFLCLVCLFPSSICMAWISSSSSNLYSNDTLVRPSPLQLQTYHPILPILFPYFATYHLTYILFVCSHKK